MPASGVRSWSELTTRDLAGLDPERTVVVLPVAATEGHGPHLPLGTDTIIAEGMIDGVRARAPDDIETLFLPVQTVGTSDEHLAFAGTLTLSAETAIRAWTGIGEAVHRAGLRKLVVVSSHGGNSEVAAIVARDLRVRLGMLAVTTAWRRFGLPEGLFDPVEAAHGIHAGDVETSLMLHFRPDLVRAEHIADFPPASIAMEREFAHLRAHGPHALAWATQDLHPDGAVGDASHATAEKGRLTAAHQADGFIRLIVDVAAFALERLRVSPTPARF